jgi:hypothetical protein
MTLLPVVANGAENTKYETTLKDETGKNSNARSSVEANLSGATLSQALKDGKLSVVINTLERPQGEVRGAIAVKK